MKLRLAYLTAICAYSWSWSGSLLVKADYNITIDDSNTTAIQYYPVSCSGGDGEWNVEVVAGLYNGTVRYCDEQDATVTFKFTGVAVYLLSPLWPYQMTMYASVDSLSADFINMTDPNAMTALFGPITVSSHPVWSSTGLDNKPHVLVLSGAASMDGHHDLNVDGFVYTAVETDTSSPSSSSSSQTSASLSASQTRSTSASQTSSTSAAPASPPSQNIPSHSQSVVGPVLGAILGTFIVLVIAWFLLHRRTFQVQSRIPHDGRRTAGIERHTADIERPAVPPRMSQTRQHSAHPQRASLPPVPADPLPRSFQTSASSDVSPPGSVALLDHLLALPASEAPLAPNRPSAHAIDTDTARSEYGGTAPPAYDQLSVGHHHALEATVCQGETGRTRIAISGGTAEGSKPSRR